jgi:hypothetical protein
MQKKINFFLEDVVEEKKPFFLTGPNLQSYSLAHGNSQYNDTNDVKITSKSENNISGGCEEPYHDYFIKLDNFDESTKKKFLEEVDDIVNITLNRENDVDMVKLKNGKVLETDKTKSGQRFVAINSELLSTMTDLVNQHFLSNEEEVSVFLKSFIELMEKTLEIYCKKKQNAISRKYNYNTVLYNDKIIFVYKGGNTLRSVIKKYLQEFPGYVNDYLYDQYGEYFKKSDCDFQIFIHPELHPDPKMNRKFYSEIFDDVRILSLLVLNRFRNIMSQSLNDIFTMHKYKKFEVRKILNEYLEKLNKCDVFKQSEAEIEKTYGENFKYFSGLSLVNLRFQNVNAKQEIHNKIESLVNTDRIYSTPTNMYVSQMTNNFMNEYDVRDMYITHDKNDKSKIIISKIGKFHKDEIIKSEWKDKELQKKIYTEKSEGSEFFISYNDDIEFTIKNQANYIVKFSLLRMKVSFFGYFKTNEPNPRYGLMRIPGELIDVSISHQDDLKNLKFAGKKFKNTFDRYKFTSQNNSMKSVEFEYNCYNIEYFINDIYVIIFQDYEYPWDDIKYKKRIFRLMFLLSIVFLTKMNKKKYDLLDQLNDYIKYLREYMSQVKNNGRSMIYNYKFLNNIRNSPLGNELLNEYLFETFNTYIFETNLQKMAKITDNTIKSKNEDKFIECVGYIDKNINILIETIEKLTEYSNDSVDLGLKDGDGKVIVHQIAGTRRKN